MHFPRLSIYQQLIKALYKVTIEITSHIFNRYYTSQETQQNLFHPIWSSRSEDTNFIRFYQKSGNSFSLKSNPKNARCSRCSAPAGADSRDP
jgi:hypothetical protein